MHALMNSISKDCINESTSTSMLLVHDSVVCNKCVQTFMNLLQDSSRKVIKEFQCSCIFFMVYVQN